MRAAEKAKWTSFRTVGVWVGEMAQWMKCVLCKSEGQSLGPQVNVNPGQVWWLPVVPTLRRQTGHPWGTLTGYSLSAGELWVKLKDPASEVESN